MSPRRAAGAIAATLALTMLVPSPAAMAEPQAAPPRASPSGPGTVDALRDVAPALAACWHPPREGDAITLRLSLRRDGSLIGRPRITFRHSASGPDGEAALANSVFAALAACAPLRLTPRFGDAVAGRVLLIRFVAPRREFKA